jgi:hypothetical protein
MERIEQRLREFKRFWKQNYQLSDMSGIDRTSPVSNAPNKSGVDQTSPVKDNFEDKIL